MTKELELFKKWYGIDLPSEEDNYWSYYVVIIEEDKIYTYPSVSGAVSKEICLKLINSSHFKHLKVMIDAPTFHFNIPPQHHAEWEAYIKEKE
jgi:hypothetical protein